MKNTYLIACFLLIFSAIQSQSFERGPFTGKSITLPVTGDFNGDGKLDIVGVSRFFSPIGDLKIHYSMSVPDSIIFETVDLELSVAGDPGVGDFDNDNDLDIVVIESKNNQILILLNNGDGTFETKPQTSKIALDFITSDIDNDGDTDIISYNTSEDEAYLMTNNGNAEFTTNTIISEVRSFTTLDIGDIDGDNDVDVIAAIQDSNGEKIIVLNNQANGSFVEQTITATGINSLENLKVVDINNDGRMDVLYSSFFNSIVKGLLNNGDGTYEAKDLAQALGGIRSFDVADFNDDGINDIMVGCNSDDNTYHQGMSNTSLEYDREVVSGIQPMFHIVNGDFDGDNDLDVILSNGDFWWLINKLDQGTVNTIELDGESYQIYPNPFKDIINIDLLKNDSKIIIMDMVGKTVFNSNETSNTYNLESLENGSYILLMLDSNTNNVLQSSKIMKIE